MKKLNILIVDDEALLREGLQSMLQHEEFTNAIYLASNDKEFRIEFSEKRIDVVLMDIRLRNASGLDLIKEVINSPNSPKIIAVTGLDGVELIVNLLKLGVHGIVYKLNGYSEIIRSIQAVMKGESYFPENVFRIIQSNAHRWDEVPSVLLTFQEKELVKAVSSGATTKEIAPQLKMTCATAETYRVRLMKKLGVANTAAMMAYAYRNGIL